MDWLKNLITQYIDAGRRNIERPVVLKRALDVPGVAPWSKRIEAPSFTNEELLSFGNSENFRNDPRNLAFDEALASSRKQYNELTDYDPFIAKREQMDMVMDPLQASKDTMLLGSLFLPAGGAGGLAGAVQTGIAGGAMGGYGASTATNPEDLLWDAAKGAGVGGVMGGVGYGASRGFQKLAGKGANATDDVIEAYKRGEVAWDDLDNVQKELATKGNYKTEPGSVSRENLLGTDSELISDLGGPQSVTDKVKKFNQLAKDYGKALWMPSKRAEALEELKALIYNDSRSALSNVDEGVKYTDAYEALNRATKKMKLSGGRSDAMDEVVMHLDDAYKGADEISALDFSDLIQNIDEQVFRGYENMMDSSSTQLAGMGRNVRGELLDVLGNVAGEASDKYRNDYSLLKSLEPYIYKRASGQGRMANIRGVLVPLTGAISKGGEAITRGAEVAGGLPRKALGGVGDSIPNMNVIGPSAGGLAGRTSILPSLSGAVMGGGGQGGQPEMPVEQQGVEQSLGMPGETQQVGDATDIWAGSPFVMDESGNVIVNQQQGMGGEAGMGMPMEMPTFEGALQRAAQMMPGATASQVMSLASALYDSEMNQFQMQYEMYQDQLDQQGTGGLDLNTTQSKYYAVSDAATRGINKAQELAQAGGRTPGFGQGTITSLEDRFNTSDPDMLEYRSLLAGIDLAVSNLISGTAISDNEAKRLKKLIPTISDSPEEAVIKLKELQRLGALGSGVGMNTESYFSDTGSGGYGTNEYGY